MALRFYCASGSPPSWKVWLALEHKRIPYEMVLLSFQAGDLKKPDFLAKNPRGKVPVLEDGPFVLWESAAILEYLEERFPEQPLLPPLPDHEGRARVRRVCAEADGYWYPAARRLLIETLYRPDGAGDLDEIAAAREEILRESEHLASELKGPFFQGDDVSLADFAVYPTMALLGRLETKAPQHGVLTAFHPKLLEWGKRVEALPYFAQTVPPHWRE
jgi:glutathione S-transferase